MSKEPRIDDLNDEQDNNFVLKHDSIKTVDKKLEKTPEVAEKEVHINEESEEHLVVANKELDTEDVQQQNVLINNKNDNDHLIPSDSVSSIASTTPSVSSTLAQHQLSVSSTETISNKNDANPTIENDIEEKNNKPTETDNEKILVEKFKEEAKEFPKIKKEVIDQSEFPLLKEELNEDYSNDFCVICRNGGDLLICDFCPRVYHLQCHVPSIHIKPE